VDLPPDRHPQSEDWKLLCLPFCKFLAVSNGATQGQSIYLILRSPVEQKRAVPKEVVWYGDIGSHANFAQQWETGPTIDGITKEEESQW